MKKRELDKEIAENAGVLGALSDADQLQASSARPSAPTSPAASAA
jgi:hypothetical protein